MKILVIGGSGSVGSQTLPFMTERYDITVYDLVPPRISSLPFIEGDVRDEIALFDAYAGCDSFIYMATSPGALNPDKATAHFDINVTGIYLALRIAHKAGISHAVVTSTMSVYDRLQHRDIDDEALPPDAVDHYGLSKRLGEEVCRAAHRQWHISISALRLCNVVGLDDLVNLSHPFIATAASDVAHALDLALQRRLAGFEAFTINGDWEETRLKLAKAKTLLGWRPLARPHATSWTADDAACGIAPDAHTSTGRAIPLRP